jgi:hypothetical protein
VKPIQKKKKKLISKPGAANSMFGKKHSEKSKLLMSIKKKLKPIRSRTL